MPYSEAATWRCSTEKPVLKKNRNIHRETPVPESTFNEVAGLRASNFNKELQHRCFPENFVKSFKTPVLKNICKRLLLHTGVTINRRSSFPLSCSSELELSCKIGERCNLDLG